jgi:hypothetical protein
LLHDTLLRTVADAMASLSAVDARNLRTLELSLFLLAELRDMAHFCFKNDLVRGAMKVNITENLPPQLVHIESPRSSTNPAFSRRSIFSSGV